MAAKIGIEAGVSALSQLLRRLHRTPLSDLNRSLDHHLPITIKYESKFKNTIYGAFKYSCYMEGMDFFYLRNRYTENELLELENIKTPFHNLSLGEITVGAFGEELLFRKVPSIIFPSSTLLYMGSSILPFGLIHKFNYDVYRIKD